MSMIKLIHSASFDPIVGAGAEIIKRSGELTKQASTIFGVDYDALKPDDKSVGIHVVALGDAEHYGQNRNGDLFPKEACVKYHDTFVKHGHVYRHHKNKDPEKSIGIIKASAYNEPMGRVELFIHADKEKAAPELERLEKEGEIPVSMACCVQHDRCFTKGTLVLTDHGFTPIENISVGDVCVTAEACLRRVIATSESSSAKLTRVSVRGIPEEIECTPNHPFNVVSFEQMRSCHGLINGIRRRHTPKNGTTHCQTCGKTIDVHSEWKQADQLVEGDYIKEKIDPCSKHVTRGVSFAYLCGMYVGDGSAIWATNGHDHSGDTARIVGLQISASAADKDSLILEKIKSAFRQCTGKEARVNPEMNGKKAYVVSLRDRLLANRIVGLTGAHCRDKFISSEILSWSIDEKAAFIAGYLDADGAVGYRDKKKRPIFRICSVNKGLLLSVQRLLWSIGVPATVGIGNTLENMKGGYKHKSSSYHVFFSKAPDVLVSSSAKLSEFCSTTTFANGGSGILLIDGYAYLPVSSSRTFDCDEVSTYNFEVEGEHTYIAEGVGVHNCSICGAMRKQAGDSSECEHVANHLGEQWDDGRKVGVYNDHPRFFDISFVGRPADRIAWNLKVASALELDSVKAAEYEGVEVPDSIACDTAVSQRKLSYLKDINTLQQSYKGWLSKQASVVSTRDRYLMEFTKVATVSLDNETISRLREQPITNAMGALASHGIIMDLESFLKYATGDSYSDVVAPYVPAVKYNLHNIISQRVKQANCASICTDATYDVPAPDSYTRLKLVPEKLNNMLKKQAFDIQEKIIDATIAGDTQNTKLIIATPSKLLYNNDKVIEKLAEAYLSYQLSAIDAVVNGCRSISKLDAEALASVSNLKQ